MGSWGRRRSRGAARKAKQRQERFFDCASRPPNFRLRQGYGGRAGGKGKKREAPLRITHEENIGRRKSWTQRRHHGCKQNYDWILGAIGRDWSVCSGSHS